MTAKSEMIDTVDFRHQANHLLITYCNTNYGSLRSYASCRKNAAGRVTPFVNFSIHKKNTNL